MEVQLILPTTEDLAASQDQGGGGNLNSSWRRTYKPERTPAKQVTVHGRISDPGGSGVLNKKEPIVAAQSQ